MKPIRGGVRRVDCPRDRRGAARRPEASIAAKARRVGRGVMTSTPCDGPRWAPRASAAVATLHGQLLARTHCAELRPERLVHLLESGNGAGRPVAAERTRAAVVGGGGGAGEIAARLLVLSPGNGEAAEIVEEDLASRLAVVLDVARKPVQVVEPAPRVMDSPAYFGTCSLKRGITSRANSSMEWRQA